MTKEETEIFLKEVEARQIARELIAKQEAAYTTDLREIEGHIYYSRPVGGMGDCPGYLSVNLSLPDGFRSEGGWDVKSGIVKQLDGKKVTVIIHD